MLKKFEILGIVEGTSMLLLMGVGMPLKYLMGFGLVNTILGYAHGFLFIAYCIFLLIVIIKLSLGLRILFLGGFAALLPAGPFVFHRYLRKYLKRKGI